MRAFVLGDLHYGVHPLTLDIFIDITEEFFDVEFIPYLKSNLRSDDIIIQLGDVFDNRTSVNIKALTLARNRFKQLSELAPVHVIVGNHDMYQERSRVYHSLNIIQHDNVTIYSEPTSLNIGSKSVLMLPYFNNPKEQKEVMENYGEHDLLLAHTDLYGARYGTSKSDTSEKGLRIEDYEKYKLIMSGHIHIRQNISNFMYTGTPYHLSRKDTGNDKGFHILDFDTLKYEFVKNNTSPEYKTIQIQELSDFDKIDVAIDRNDWVDVKVDIELMDSSPKIKNRMKKLSETGRVQSIEYVDTVAQEYTFAEDESKTEILPSSWDINQLSKAYIENLPHEAKLKEKIEEKLDELMLHVKF